MAVLQLDCALLNCWIVSRAVRQYRNKSFSLMGNGRRSLRSTTKYIILSTRDELDKALAELAVLASSCHRSYNCTRWS